MPIQSNTEFVTVKLPASGENYKLGCLHLYGKQKSIYLGHVGILYFLDVQCTVGPLDPVQLVHLRQSSQNHPRLQVSGSKGLPDSLA